MVPHGWMASWRSQAASTLGPWIVTADELHPLRDVDLQHPLAMTVAVNSVRVGVEVLAHMAWSFADLTAYASRST